MPSPATSTIVGMIFAAGLAVPAFAQLELPCDAFARDDGGVWYAMQPATVGTAIGLIEVMPGHPVSLQVASVLDAVCR